jgi:hypothetical protein
MPVPFEALIPFGKLLGNTEEIQADLKGLLTVMFGATGTLFSIVKRAQNDWKVSLGNSYRLDSSLPRTVRVDQGLTSSSHLATT